MIIAIDIDQVLADTTQPIIDFYNKKLNASVILDENFSYALFKNWNLEKEDSLKIVDEFIANESINIEPIDGAIEAISKLKEKGFRLFAVTARPRIHENITKEWINRHFGDDTFFEIISTNQYNDPNEAKKSYFLKEFGASMIIDDNPYNCEECFDNGFNAILFNMNNQYPWGKTNNEKIQKVTSWDEVLNNIQIQKEVLLQKNL
ncbi:hypothetical protein C0585_07975 [Candidatus Woesearchaeota archaeon]|nr:MAG: hypothetical protein C0585_07975 [Candidatus Woesearchaeota archaeon]